MEQRKESPTARPIVLFERGPHLLLPQVCHASLSNQITKFSIWADQKNVKIQPHQKDRKGRSSCITPVAQLTRHDTHMAGMRPYEDVFTDGSYQVFDTGRESCSLCGTGGLKTIKAILNHYLKHDTFKCVCSKAIEGEAAFKKHMKCNNVHYNFKKNPNKHYLIHRRIHSSLFSQDLRVIEPYIGTEPLDEILQNHDTILYLNDEYQMERVFVEAEVIDDEDEDKQNKSRLLVGSDDTKPNADHTLLAQYEDALGELLIQEIQRNSPGQHELQLPSLSMSVMQSGPQSEYMTESVESTQTPLEEYRTRPLICTSDLQFGKKRRKTFSHSGSDSSSESEIFSAHPSPEDSLNGLSTVSSFAVPFKTYYNDSIKDYHSPEETADKSNEVDDDTEELQEDIQPRDIEGPLNQQDKPAHDTAHKEPTLINGMDVAEEEEAEEKDMQEEEPLVFEVSDNYEAEVEEELELERLKEEKERLHRERLKRLRIPLVTPKDPEFYKSVRNRKRRLKELDMMIDLRLKELDNLEVKWTERNNALSKENFRLQKIQRDMKKQLRASVRSINEAVGD